MSQAVRPRGEEAPVREVHELAGAGGRLPSKVRERAFAKMRELSLPLGIGLGAHLSVLLLALGVAYATRQPFNTLLRAWDSRWYLKVAATGYPHHLLPGHGNAAQSTLGFFPVLPLLIRFVHIVVGTGYLGSGVIVSFVTSLTAAVAVWLALCDVTGREAATRGTAVVLFSPGAFVLGMVYSEGILITCMALCMVALRRQRWVTAGLLAAVASATDPLGLAALAPCAVIAWKAMQRERSWRPLLAPLLAPAGVVAFFSFLWAWAGTPLAWFITQRRGWESGAPFAGIPHAWSYVVQYGFHDINDTVKTVSVVVILALLALFLRSRPDPAELAYVLATLALAAASPIVSWTPRVALRAFPLLGAPGARAPRRHLPLILGCSAVLMATLAVMSWSRSPIPYTP